jgi:hypothetical protein
MRVLSMHCTGPCGDYPPGSQKHCSEMVLVPWSDVRLPEPGAPLSPKAQEVLLTLGRAVCGRIDPTKCRRQKGNNLYLRDWRWCGAKQFAAV